MDPSENENYNELVAKLGLSQSQLAQVANFANSKYPDIDLEFEVEDQDDISAGAPAHLKVAIERNLGEDDDTELDTTVHAPFYPVKKLENWWLVVGEDSTKTLLAIKRISIGKKLNLRLEFTVPTPGQHELKLYLMSDSYVAVDQELTFNVNVGEGVDEDDEDEEME